MFVNNQVVVYRLHLAIFSYVARHLLFFPPQFSLASYVLCCKGEDFFKVMIINITKINAIKGIMSAHECS